MSSYPTHELALEPDVFREAYTTYLGAESPACRPLAGRVLPVAGARVTYCDASGHVLSAVQLPVETYDESHDAIVDRFSSLMDEAGFRPRTEPRIFTTLIPPAVLLAPGGRPGIIPDLMAAVTAMPAALVHRDVRAGPGAAGVFSGM